MRVVLRCGGSVSQDEDTVVVDFLHKNVSRARRVTALTDYEHRIAAMVLASRGRQTSMTTLGEGLYADQDDGGPLNLDVSVRQLVWRIRKKLRHLGINIMSTPWLGYEAAVEPMPQAPPQVPS